MNLSLSKSTQLLGEIDPDRAPRDAPAAADAARLPELVVPRPELVGEPVPISRSDTRANDAGGEIRKLEREARVPPAPPFGVVAREVGHILDGRAEARRADHRAIGATKAALADIEPRRTLCVALQKIARSCRVDRSLHLPDDPIARVGDETFLFWGDRPRAELGQNLAAHRAPRLEEETMAVLVDPFRHGEIEPAVGERPRTDRSAEARGSRFGAVRDDHEAGPTTLRVRRVWSGAVAQDAILHCDRRRVA